MYALGCATSDNEQGFVRVKFGALALQESCALVERELADARERAALQSQQSLELAAAALLLARRADLEHVLLRRELERAAVEHKLDVRHVRNRVAIHRGFTAGAG